LLSAESAKQTIGSDEVLIIDVDVPDDLQMDVSRNKEREKCKRKFTAMEDDDRIISVSSEEQRYHIVRIHEWLNGDDNQILPIVDLRSYEEFDRQHIDMTSYANSGNNNTVPTIVNLPIPTLLSGERSCELPPRHVEFVILIPRQYTQQFLECSDDCEIHQLFFASVSKTTLQSRKPWLVRQILIDCNTLWKDASELGLVKSWNRECTTSFQRLPRLWKPDPITTNILPILKEWTIKEDQNRIGLVLDLGSGAGRDICYLAEELKEYQCTQQQQSFNSIHVVGIDNHKGSAKRCVPLWKNRGVDDITDSLLLDLNKLHQVRSTLIDTSMLLLSQPMQQQSEIICLYAIRFLNRKLLSYIANSTIHIETDSIESKSISKSDIHSPPQPLILPIGTIFAMSHFCKPKDGATWNFDHPKESSVLERSELKNLFESKGWQVLRDDIILDGDHGRTLIQFIAKKIA